MTTETTDTQPEVREPLNRDRILRAAVAYADEHGIEALSMRKLGQQLGVEAMSLYNHVSNKEDILDGMTDAVFEQIPVPAPDADWREASRVIAVKAKDIFAVHPWFVPLVTSREAMGPAALNFMNSVLGLFRRSGFDRELTMHAWFVISSHVLGYAFQESSAGLVSDEPDRKAEMEMLKLQFGDQFPVLAEMAPILAECVVRDEFRFGLEIILDGLEARLQASRA